MEINLNFLLGLAIAITITLLNTRLKFSKLGWKKFFLVAVILSNPWKIGKDVFSIFGGWNDEGSIYSLCPVFQKTSGHAFGVLAIGYQDAERDAEQVIGLSCQRAGGNAMQLLGLAYQKARGNAGQLIGLSWQEAEGEAWQVFGLRVFASSNTITRGTFLAIPPIVSEEKGAAP